MINSDCFSGHSRLRRYARLIVLALSASVSLVAGADAARPDASYHKAQGSKAIAMVPGQPHSQAAVIAQANDVAAAANAQAACDARRSPDAAPCEIVWLNDEQIATGAQIKQSLPKEAHPLYLWRFKSDTATVYLAGSIHILKPSLYPLPDPFEQAFAAADHLVVEVNVGGYSPVEIQKATLSRALLPDGQSLRTLLSDDTYARTSDVLARHGISMDMVARGKPAMVMQQLLIARLMAIGYPPTSGVEQHFLARAGNRQILELETLEAQLDLLFNQPLPLQKQLLLDTLDQSDDVDELMTRMIGAWLRGSDEELLALFEQQTGESPEAKAFNEQLLDVRNHGMVEKIKQYLQGTGTYLVLIGAAHYVGDAGIIALLRAQQITGQRINSDTQL